MAEVSVKAVHNGVKRRFSLSDGINYEGLQTTLCDMFPVSKPYSITYIDDDHDLVVLSSDAELKELFRLVEKKVISTIIIILHDGEKIPTNTEHTGHAFGFGFAQHKRMGRHHFHGRRGMMMRGGRGGRGGHGAQENMPPFMIGIRVLMHSMPDYSEDVKTSFQTLKSAAAASKLEPQALRQIKKDMFPTLFKAVSDALSADSETTEGALSNEGIGRVCSDVELKLKDSVTTEDLSTAILNFIRTALSDPAVMKVVRSLPLDEMTTDLEKMQATESEDHSHHEDH